MSALMYQDYDPVRDFLNQYKQLVREQVENGPNPTAGHRRSVNHRFYIVLELFASLVNHLLAQEYAGMRVVAFGVNHAESVLSVLAKAPNPKVADILDQIIVTVNPEVRLVTFDLRESIHESRDTTGTA